MKLSLLSYGIGSVWSLQEMIDVALRNGFAGLDFRCAYGNSHGVEIERSAGERREIRHRIEDAFLEAVCIRSGARFESPDPAVRRENIDAAKRHIDLAGDIGATFVRVSGHNIPPDVPREQVVENVAQGLAELADAAAERGIRLLLEMLGDFKNWHFALSAVEAAHRSNLGLLYNSESCDIFGGSVVAIFDRIKHLVWHVDLHDLTGSYPYGELMGLLREVGYTGYFCPEPMIEEPSREGYLALYAELVRARWREGGSAGAVTDRYRRGDVALGR